MANETKNSTSAICVFPPTRNVERNMVDVYKRQFQCLLPYCGAGKRRFFALAAQLLHTGSVKQAKLLCTCLLYTSRCV